MKHRFLSLLFFLLSVTAYGQSYTAMWKNVEKAVAKDLPKTALVESQKIYARAVGDDNAGQMLKAVLMTLQLHGTISPDSASAYISQLDSAAVRETDPVVKAVFNLALGRLHADRQSHKNAAEGDKSLACLRNAVADLSIFEGHKTEEFVPVMITRTDGKYFEHDLLSFVCRETIAQLGTVNYSSTTEKDIATFRRNTAHSFIEHYRRAGNDNAVILATLDSLDSEPSYAVSYEDSAGKQRFDMLQRLTEQYQQSTCAVEAYIKICELLARSDKTRGQRFQWAQQGVAKYRSNPRCDVLRNVITDMTRPTCRAEFPATSLYENQSIRVPLEAVNASEITLAFYRLPYAPYDKAVREADYSALRKKVTKPAFTEKITLNRNNEYDDINDTIVITPKRIGIYLVTLSIDGKESRSDHLIYVSNLRLMRLSLPGKKNRLVVVNPKSGHPVAGANVKVYRNENGEYKLLDTYNVGNEGEVILPNTTAAGRTYYYPCKEEDIYANGSVFYGYTNFNTPAENSARNIKLFTDRAIYRPGQKVHVAGIAYKRNDDTFETLYEQQVAIELHDANHKKIADMKVKSDEFGAFGTDFILPQSCLPGVFSITSDYGSPVRFRVEEYKRPTFEVEITKPEGAYSIGDSVSVKGKARAFMGEGVANATVVYTVKRRTAWWMPDNDIRSYVFNDTTSTDDDGNFTMHIPLTQESEILSVQRNRSYCFIADITVTSPDGESQIATTSIPAGTGSLHLTCDMPQRILKSVSSANVTFTLNNAANQPIAHKGEYIIYKETEKCVSASFNTNEPSAIPALGTLPSGKYHLMARLIGADVVSDTLCTEFTLFSLTDKRPADDSELWHYVSSPVLSNDSNITVQFGTSLNDIVAFYDVVGNGKLLESKRFFLSDTIVNMHYRYKEEFGNGIAVTFGFMHEGKVYSHTEKLTKPVPDKRLRFKWTTFRNRLHPGEAEEWCMNVYEPDESPANASVIAMLYDASLDKFAKNVWNVSPEFYRFVPSASWASRNNGFSIYADMERKHLSPCALEFDGFDENLFGRYISAHDEVLSLADTAMPATRSVLLSVNTTSFAKSKAMQKSAKAETEATLEISDLKDTVSGTAAGNEEQGEAEEMPDIRIRENFAETAFFSPALKTDANGLLCISFTVPESLTRWNLKLLAHTKTMNCAVTDTTAVVTKDFMIQPNLPRYLRASDKAVVSATLRNLTTHRLSGTSYLALIDARTENIIETHKTKFSVDGNSQAVVSFDFEVSKDYPLLICRITADAGMFSDGEQHYLPVLSDETESITAIPFTIKGKGKKVTDIIKIFFGTFKKERDIKLTVEYTANPLWYVVQALPNIQEPKFPDAISIASAFYATSIERYIAGLSPELARAAARWATEQSADTLVENALLRNEDLKNIVLNETPWVAEAANINGRRRNLARAFDYTAASARERNLLDRLILLQRGDGGWSWFPGMPSSFYVTERVMDMLARLQRLTGQTSAKSAMSKGIAYMDGIVAEKIAQMKESERKGTVIKQISGNMLMYLDILRRFSGRLSAQAKANSSYLIDKLAKYPVYDNMYHKALAAQILAESGHRQVATTTLQSLLEHTVVKAETGRYFDTDLAPTSWESYKIPTQVAALEALRLIHPNDTDTQEQMLTWLIQSKRTQSWSNERNTVEAVYALLLTADSTSGLLHFDTSMPQTATVELTNGKILDIMGNGGQESETLGYVRSDYALDTIAKPRSLTITKTDDGISWGGVYHRALVPIAETVTNGDELKVERTYFVQKNGKYVAIPEDFVPQVGDRIRVRYTVTAARDFDFVSLQDSRPACFEPVKSLSGYMWNDGEPYYYAVRDTGQGFFFERMSKGVHTFHCDHTVNLAGSYLSGTAVVQCLYSPEFIGTAKGFTVNTRK